MHRFYRPAIAGLFVFSLCTAAPAVEHAHWSHAGKKNEAPAPIFVQPPKPGAPARELQLDPAALLPADHRALLYTGSLTTPPCTEQVHWVVMEQPIEMSRAQISVFRRLFPDNHRPVQPLNGREPVEEIAGE